MLLLILLGAPAAAQEPSEAKTPEEAAEAPEEAAEAPEEAEAAPEEGGATAGQAEVELDAAQLEDALDSAAPPASDDMEEILVTGIRREDLLQDVPISITSFNAAEIKSLRIQNIADLAEYTPNLEINTAFAASNPTLFIRGIGLKDYNANAAGAVAVYQDGININSPAIQLGQIFDTRSIEVLKGPQGSLNGRNASAGAIMINSVLPDGEFGFNSSFTYGNYNTIEAEAGLSIPIIEDMLSARVAFTANFRDGVTKNQCAKHDPTQYTNAAGDPFLEISEQTTQDLYSDLEPLEGERVLVLVGENPPDANTQRQINNREQAERRFVFQNVDLFKQLLEDGTINGELARVPRLDDQGEIFLDDDDKPEIEGRVGFADLKLLGFKKSAVDGVCIVDTPGNVLTDEGVDGFLTTNTRPLRTGDYPVLLPDSNDFQDAAAGQFLAKTDAVTLGDLQGLKSYINNVDNWAGRGILRFQPLEGMDWLLNFHGGQNSSDSAHLQSIGADALDPEPGDNAFKEAFEQNWNEKQAAEITGAEGLTGVPGLDKLLEPVPGGQTGDDPFIGWYNLDGQEFIDAWGTSLRGFWDLGGRRPRSSAPRARGSASVGAAASSSCTRSSTRSTCFRASSTAESSRPSPRRSGASPPTSVGATSS
jgi:hypothetical protein